MATPNVLAPNLAAEERRNRYLRIRSNLELVVIYIVVVLFCMFILVPFIWPFLTAFTNKPANVSTLYLYWPKEFTWSHFNEAINGRGQAITLLRNSSVVAIVSVLLSLIVCTLGGYALSRGRIRYKRALMFMILLIQVIPATATVLPLYLIMRQFSLVNTLAGVALGVTTGQLPFMLWVMKGFIDTVPMELEETAWLDGASLFQTLTRIVLPLTLPGIGAASILAFNGVWGAFFLPLVLLSDGDKFTMPLGLFRSVLGYTNMDYGMLNAMSLLYLIPGFLIFIFARQYLIRGTMAGAIAGQ
jgi:ABC-type glycerol-3-phosphate transport system permease component